MGIACNATVDDEFGPAVKCDEFDFTLAFEQTIFLIATSSLFIVVAIVRLTNLYTTPAKLDGLWWLYGAKLLFAIGVLVTKLASLVLWARYPSTHYATVAASVTFAGATALATLILLEHKRSKRPSSAVSIYLLAQIVAESTILRTLELRQYSPSLIKITWVGIFLQVALLLLESTTKRHHLRNPAKYGVEETAGIIDRSVLWWLNKLFWQGNRHVLNQSDLFQLDNDLRSGRLRDRIVLNWDEKKTGENALLWTLLSSILVPFMRTVFPRAAWIALGYSQTFLINAALKFLEIPVNERDKNHAYGLIGATALIYLGIAIADAATQEKRNRMVALFRGSVVSLVYDKALHYPSVDDDLPTATLMSADVDQLNNALMYSSEVWAILVELGIGIGLLWRQMGPVALAPVVLTAFAAGINAMLARLQGKSRGIWLQAMQKRVGLTSTVLGSVKCVKMEGLSESTGSLLQKERVCEISKANSFRWLTVWQNSISELPLTLSGLLVFAVYAVQVHLGSREPLTTAKAYTSLALITMITQPASMLLQSISAIISVSGNIRRLEEYLRKADFGDTRRSNQNFSSKAESSPNAVVLDHVILDLPSKFDQTSMNIAIKAQTTTMITGQVGSGKSTLLKLILGETMPKSGKVTLRVSSIAYCSATPWLRNVTIKENIIGDKEWDDQWYQKVIHACDLVTDMALLPQGIDTIVGSRGVTLSGGQRHRLALARALYSRCPLILLDGSFGALDARTKINVASRVLKHTRKHGLTLIFTSHDEVLAQFADYVVVLPKDGSTVSLEPSSKRMNHKKTDSESVVGDDSRSPDPVYPENSRTEDSARMSESKDDDERVKRQIGDTLAWKYYAKSIGVFHCMLLLFFTIVAILASNFPRIWLKDSERSKTALGLFVGVYATAAVLEGVGMAAMLWESMIKIASKSSIKLHQILVKTTFNAPMSYFDSVDNSVTLNRFSQDMMLIEAVLPIMTYLSLQGLVSCIVQLVLVAMGSSYMATIIPLLLLVLYLVQKFYLRTSRQLRFLDLEAKTPLYKQFTETTEGIATIRAFGSQEWFRREFLSRLDESQKPYYLLLCIQRWLGLVLNMVVGGAAIVLVALACTTRSSSSGSLGVALTTILTANTQLQHLVSAWTQAETSLGSVARVKDFEAKTANENLPLAEHQEELDEPWPIGDIEVHGLTVRYQKDGNEHVALEDVSFNVKAGQKLGIIGRTGSGKSTLLSVILRLVDPTSGHITIDNIAISTISRETIRNCLICLPQDPFLLPGTLKYNLDPKGRSTHTQLKSVLQEVQLFDLVASRGGIAAEFQPDSFSHGERQLLVTARAILRNRLSQGRSILIMDEATGNLDTRTATVIHEVIAREFVGQTIISVAHRPEALKDCDVVLELHEGKVVRFGPAGTGSWVGAGSSFPLC